MEPVFELLPSAGTSTIFHLTGCKIVYPVYIPWLNNTGTIGNSTQVQTERNKQTQNDSKINICSG